MREALGERAARILAKTFYAYTKQLFQFAKNNLALKLISSPRKSENEGVFVGIFLRMYLWMESLTALDRPSHFQGVAVALRSLFELFLDLKMLADDENGECYEKYIAFSEIEMFREGSKKVKFYERNYPEEKEKYFFQNQFTTDPERIKRITENLKRFWPKDDINDLGKIKHWTKMDARGRAGKIGKEYEKIYVDFYSQLSEIVHGSGLEFFRKLDKEQFEAYYAFCHETVHKIFIDAIKIVVKKLEFDKTWEQEGLYKKLDELKDENMMVFQTNIEEELENQQK
ncbi:MAG: DUF5677 domain-containing protein [Thermodesulfovibrionales bacterium]|nr:DUF5677 domain-containing protein [Thermodesulfovibrionales bacterium]